MIRPCPSSGRTTCPPAHVLVSTQQLAHQAVSNPSDSSLPTPGAGDVVEGFRAQLVASVERRVAASRGVIAHLSGGLDSGVSPHRPTSWPAEARLSAPVSTMSVVFPDHPKVDESRLDRQGRPMSPSTTTPWNRIVPIDVFSEDMEPALRMRIHCASCGPPPARLPLPRRQTRS